jgi:pimeloyl-ACP methyl ester carboxylesterase
MEGVIWLIWSIFLGQIGYLGRIGHLGPINAKLAGWRWGAAVAWRYSQFSIDGFDHVIGQHAVDELELTGKKRVHVETGLHASDNQSVAFLAKIPLMKALIVLAFAFILRVPQEHDVSGFGRGTHVFDHLRGVIRVIKTVARKGQVEQMGRKDVGQLFARDGGGAHRGVSPFTATICILRRESI